MYIVSPNADMRRLPQLVKEYSTTFPSLPGLPKILALLSGKPKPFATYIPSKDHRSAYLDILAWLLRHGLVTQLRNFAWIKVPRDIKLAVLAEEAAEAAAGADSSPSSDDKAKGKDRDKAQVTAPLATPDGLRNGELLGRKVEEDELQETFILNPAQASGRESKWLEMMTRGQPSDVKALFDRIARYLNGEHALEKIPMREGISRKEVRRVLGVLERFVVYARHW